ncbi:MAG TPA: cache domain-containing protein, partial [Candidatus Obscuribacterales bacterium]
MKMHRFNRAQALPLQLVLIIPFILQIFGAVGLVGYLSFKNGQKAVNELADQLMERTSHSVDQHLDAYLSIPHKIIQINADAIQMGLLDVRDRETVAKYFWRQMQAYDLSYIGIGLTTGEEAGAGRYDGKTVTVDDWTNKPPNNCYTYATDNQGNRTKLMTVYDWDNFSMTWYTEPMKAGKPVWSRIYTWNYPGYPYIVASAGRPIYDRNNQLLGMVGADIHLLKLSDFLRNMEASHAGQVFILERSGLLIANSGTEKPFTLVKDEIQRLPAIASPNSAVRGVTQKLKQQFGDFRSITKTQKIKFDLEGELQYVRVAPWRDQYGLDWLVVVSVPENVFMAQINANNRTTVLLCLGALAIASVLGVFTSRWITRPILRLNRATEDMAAGHLDQTIEDSGIQELNKLSASFNHMAGQLR